ncbi:MAG: penicillin-binding protein [Flavobacteriales bacterium]|jgi:cell division protein FtsI (penicillin-binding protein 3)
MRSASNNISESTIKTGRFWVLFVSLCFVGIAILWRIFCIQTFEHEHWTERGAEFQHSIRNIAPARGQIQASDGSLLATSVPVYNLRWDSKCEAIKWSVYNEKFDSLCSGFAKILGGDSEEFSRLFEEAKAKGSRAALFAKNIPFTKYKSLKSLPFVREGRYKSGFVFERKEVRKKPFGQLAKRTIGIDRENSRVGIELAWNKELGGVEGKQMQKRISGGTWLPVTDEFIIEPQEGLDVVTTIDMHLQDVASSALRTQLFKHDADWGVVVLMEVKTGYVRAISNLKRLEDSKGLPYYNESYNHALGTAVEPGSTFKLASLMACLESGKMGLNDVVDTKNGEYYFHDRRMRDSNWKDGGHGKISLRECFEMSSNIGSALSVKQCFSLEPQEFLDKLKRMGVTEPLGVNLVGEGIPQVYSSVGEGDWSGISLTQMAIGYEVTQTPLQTLALYGAIANNGKMMRPTFVTETQRKGVAVEKFEPVVVKNKICSSSTLRDCKIMLESACAPGGNGTASNIFVNKPYTVAGKTGTSKIAENGGYARGRYRASFTGYFPADDPEFVCIVVIADTKSGSYYGSTIAAPVFMDLADLIYATDPSFHTISDEPLLALKERHLPTSKNGAREELVGLYEILGVPFVQTDEEGDWVRVTTESDNVKLTTRIFEDKAVPDVRGMGLRDALYLLENAGVKVRYEGNGTVRKQSIPAGTPLTPESTIRIELS